MMEPRQSASLEALHYIGPSMNPIFKAGDRLQIISYDQGKIRVGDVVVFISPRDGSKVVHRVSSVSSQGIKTRGDNCDQLDQWVLDPKQVLGRVTRAQRRNRRRRIFGGLLGRLFAAKVRVIHAMDSRVSCLLRPAYDELARVGIFSRLLPAQMRPRVISFNRDPGIELQLVMGRRVIGRRLPGRTGWSIRRPFRLFVDEEALTENLGKGSVVRC
jgi:hypothetical protein